MLGPAVSLQEVSGAQVEPSQQDSETTRPVIEPPRKMTDVRAKITGIISLKFIK